MTLAQPSPPAAWPGLRTVGDPAEHLQRFLARHGHRPEQLVDQVGGAFGELCLVVASGSVVVGYANQGSDLDVYAVGSVPDTQGVPIVSHELGPLVDIALLSETELIEVIDRLQGTPRLLVAGGALAAAWRDTSRLLDRLVRLAYGVVLHSTPAWSTRQAALAAPWLTERTATWWRMEAVRHSLVASWLRAVRPRLSAQLACDAQLASLKALTSEAGFPYVHLKWLPAELRALGWEDSLQRFRAALTAAWDDPAGAGPDSVEDLDPDGAARGLVVEASYLPGVTVHPIRGRTLASRWELRGRVIDEADLPPARRGGRAIWSGAVDEKPPGWLVEMVAAGLVWIGVCHED